MQAFRGNECALFPAHCRHRGDSEKLIKREKYVLDKSYKLQIYLELSSLTPLGRKVDPSYRTSVFIPDQLMMFFFFNLSPGDLSWA